MRECGRYTEKLAVNPYIPALGEVQQGGQGDILVMGCVGCI
jgi:hypothetical protein